MHPRELREKIRNGQFTGHTSGVCADYVQANVVILPKEYAFDFLLFTVRNPKSCPVIDVLEPGVYESAFASGSDIRSDLPLYYVYENGQLSQKLENVSSIWREDFVTFLIGCSFTFESQLLKASIPLRHVEQGKNVAMYQTSLQTVSAGSFQGPLVVSMRPIKDEFIPFAKEITAKFPKMHGFPIHIGDPAAIGIKDITQPDYGDFVEINAGETPVFWACGVTPQAVALQSKIPLMITHAPGHMFVTDWSNEEYLESSNVDE